MILATLAGLDAYASVVPGIEEAIAWLRRFDPAQDDGRHEIDGERLFALVSSYDTGPSTEKRFESHRRYLDVQYVAGGLERILHAPVSDLEVETPYHPGGDIAFYAEPPQSSSFLVRPGDAAVFFPEDGHKPGCMAGGRHRVKKVVVKVRLPA